MGALSSRLTPRRTPYVLRPIRRGFDLPPTLCVNAAVSKDGRSLFVNFDCPVPPRFLVLSGRQEIVAVPALGYYFFWLLDEVFPIQSISSNCVN